MLVRRAPKALADKLVDFVGLEKPRRNARVTPAHVVREQVNAMRSSDDWSQARPVHLLGLYEWMHEQVYGVLPVEITGKGKSVNEERMKATAAAGRMLEKDFGGVVGEMVDYIRWICRRELRAEKWAKETRNVRGRLTWYKLFVARNLLSDYLVDRRRGNR